jgi:hypothetical protein
MDGLSATQFASQAMTGGSNSIINGTTGQAMQPMSKTQLNSNYQASRSAFQGRMATANQMSAALTPTKLMQNSGRSPEFIAAHTSMGGMR